MDKPAVVGVIDTTKDTAGVSMSPIASPTAVAVNPATSMVYVTEGSELAVINPAGPTTTAIPIQ
jgi:DNA-binding beta-propeller fold protein YncE